MSWTEAMQRYGSDKLDLRVNLEFTDMTDVMRDVDFKVFASAATTAGSRVGALRVQGGGEMSRSEIDAYTQFVGIYGAKGLAYIKVNDVAKGPRGARSRPSSRTCTMPRWPNWSSAPARRTATSSSSARIAPRWSTTPSARCA